MRVYPEIDTSTNVRLDIRHDSIYSNRATYYLRIGINYSGYTIFRVTPPSTTISVPLTP